MSTPTILTVDIVVLNANSVLLIRRRKGPYEGMWALPGGKVEETDQSLEDAALRELAEETGITINSVTDGVRQVGAFGNLGRDPRPGRWVSVAFLTLIEGKIPPIIAGSDAADAQWFPLRNLPVLAFDHGKILAAVIALQKEEKLINHRSFPEMTNDARHALEDTPNVSVKHQNGSWQIGFPPVTKVLQGKQPGTYFYLLHKIVYAFDGTTLDVMSRANDDWKSRFANASYILDAN
jgi:8-oxo-dGTP diphosphatase